MNRNGNYQPEQTYNVEPVKEQQIYNVEPIMEQQATVEMPAVVEEIQKKEEEMQKEKIDEINNIVSNYIRKELNKHN